MTTDRLETIRAHANLMTEFTPHSAQLGISFEHAEGDKLTMRLPWHDEFVGNPASGSAHGGVLTLLMDHVLGLAALCSEQMRPSITPTLDLRVDHLGPSTPGKDLLATCWVYKVEGRLVFSEGIAWCDSPDKPIAKGMGSFIFMKDFDFQELQKLREKK